MHFFIGNTLGSEIAGLSVCILCILKDRTSLVAQGLRLHAPNAGHPDMIPGQGTRFHILQLKPGAAK